MGASPSKRHEIQLLLQQQQQSDSRSQSLPPPQRSNLMAPSQRNNSSNQSQRISTAARIKQLINNPELSKLSSSQGIQIRNDFKPSMINLSSQNQTKYISPNAQGITHPIQQQSQPIIKESLGKKIKSKIQRNELQINNELKISHQQGNNIKSPNFEISRQHESKYQQIDTYLQQQKYQNPQYQSFTHCDSVLQDKRQHKVLKDIDFIQNYSESLKPSTYNTQALNAPQICQQYQTDKITQKQCKSVDSSSRNHHLQLQEQQQQQQHDSQQLCPSSLSISSKQQNLNSKELVSNRSFNSQTPQVIQCNYPNTIKFESNQNSLKKQVLSIDISQDSDSSLIIIDPQQSNQLPKTLSITSSYCNNPQSQHSLSNIDIDSTQLQPISAQQDPKNSQRQPEQLQSTIQQHVKVSIKPCQIQPSFQVKHQNNLHIQNDYSSSENLDHSRIIQQQTRITPKDIPQDNLQTTQSQNMPTFNHQKEINSFINYYGTHHPINQPLSAVIGDTSAHHSCFESITEDKIKSVELSLRKLDHCRSFKNQGMTSAFNTSNFKVKNEENGDQDKCVMDGQKHQQKATTNTGEFTICNTTENVAECMVPGSPQYCGNQTTIDFQITKTEEENEDEDDHNEQGQQKQLTKIDIPLESINVHLHFQDLESSSISCKSESAQIINIAPKTNNQKISNKDKLDNLETSQIQLDKPQSQSQISQSSRSQSNPSYSSNIQKSLSISQKIKQFIDYQQMNKKENAITSASDNNNTINKSLEEGSKSSKKILNKPHNSFKLGGNKKYQELSLLEDFENEFEGNTQTLDSREEVTELAVSPREFARDQISFGPEKRFLTDTCCGQDDLEGVVIPTEDTKTEKLLTDQIQSNLSLSFSSTAHSNHFKGKSSTTQSEDAVCRHIPLLQQQKQIFASVDSNKLNKSNLLHQIETQQNEISSNLNNSDIVYFKYDKVTKSLIPLTQDYIVSNLLKDQALSLKQEQYKQQAISIQQTSQYQQCQQGTRLQNLQNVPSDNTKINYFLNQFNKSQVQQHSQQHNNTYTNYSQSISMSHGSTAATSKRHSFQQPQSSTTQQYSQQQGNSKSMFPNYYQRQDRNLTEDTHKKIQHPSQNNRDFSNNPNKDKGSTRSMADKYLFNQTRSHLYTEVLDHYQQLLRINTKGQQKYQTGQQQQQKQQQQQMVFTRGRKAQK